MKKLSPLLKITAGTWNLFPRFGGENTFHFQLRTFIATGSVHASSDLVPGQAGGKLPQNRGFHRNYSGGNMLLH